MREVELPISKSIVNRILIIQAMRGEPLLDVSGDNMPDDVVLLHDALLQIENQQADRLDLKNCGTAMRFLTAYCAQKEGLTIVLDGSPRMRQRPILQLVDALLACGADIQFEGEYGYPPLLIHGRALTPPISETNQHPGLTMIDPVSSQFVSALLLIGADVESNVSSPYIDMTRTLINSVLSPKHDRNMSMTQLAHLRDWSGAAFWYEYVALHGGEVLLRDLKEDGLQGDSVVKDIYLKLGIQTTQTEDGVIIRQVPSARRHFLFWNFRSCPDLYPAVAITCKQKGIHLLAIGTESLKWKESDRKRAVNEGQTYHDHRIAMALMAAGLPCDDTECIRKSYPLFEQQLCQLNA